MDNKDISNEDIDFKDEDKDLDVIDLHCLLYVSRMKKEYSKEDLKDMLNRFRENNKTYNISGLMLYYDGNIIQYIEGDKKNVYILYNNIKNDIKHYNITKVVDESITRRNFVDWDMGFKEIDKNQFMDFSLHKLKLNNKRINTFFEQFLITFC